LPSQYIRGKGATAALSAQLLRMPRLIHQVPQIIYFSAAWLLDLLINLLYRVALYRDIARLNRRAFCCCRASFSDWRQNGQEELKAP
jgi:hypothetical protein